MRSVSRSAGELRHARERRGLSRAAFLAESGLDIAVQTLATYEHGTRAVGLSQLFTLCRALEIDPIALLNRVYRTVGGTDTEIRVDLGKLAQSADPRLRPLRVWARLRVRDRPSGEDIEVAFGTEALDGMAGLCRMDHAEFVDALLRNGIATRFTKGDVNNGQ